MKHRREPGGRAPGRAGPPPRKYIDSRAGFTLLEVLLSLALIALIAGVLVGGSAKLMSDQPVSADEVFWKASGEARKMALKSGNETHLAFVDDPKLGKRLNVTDGTTSKDFPIIGAPELVVTFLPVQPVAGSAIILAGQVVETEGIPFVRFYEDGTCSGFRVQVRVGPASHILNIDPWTCAQVLTGPEAAGS